MKQLILTQFPWPWLTAMALIIFFSFFVSMCFYINHRSQKKKIHEASLIPLNDEVLHHE